MSTASKPRQAMPGLRHVLPVLLLLAAVACGDSSTDEGGLPVVEIVNARGETARLRIEIAATPAERNLGLSNRPSLAEDAGMLFDIPERGIGFWMKDTLIPLSVAFLSECGRIVHIAHMEPLSLDIHNTDLPYRFGLEVNQGWFEDNGIALGDTVRLPESLRQPNC